MNQIYQSNAVAACQAEQVQWFFWGAQIVTNDELLLFILMRKCRLKQSLDEIKFFWHIFSLLRLDSIVHFPFCSNEQYN